MTKACSHLDSVRTVKPSARGCEECLKIFHGIDLLACCYFAFSYG
jgi:hypothetical protein